MVHVIGNKSKQDLELHLNPPLPHKCGTKTSGGKLVVSQPWSDDTYNFHILALEALRVMSDSFKIVGSSSWRCVPSTAVAHGSSHPCAATTVATMGAVAAAVCTVASPVR